MSAPAANETPRASGRRPSAGIWIAAAAEIGMAVLFGLIIARSGDLAPPMTHSMPGMADMPSHHHVAQIHWAPGPIAVVVFSSVTLLWWVITRNQVLAVLASIGLVGVVASEPVRTLALQSHLVAMVALDAVLVAAPLLLVAVARHRAGPLGDPRPRGWSAWAVIAVAANSSLLIVLHLPTVHGHAAYLTAVPRWLPIVAVLIGLCYWASILLTEDKVALGLRRGALIVGQEVAMLLGLAALFFPSASMNHANPLGLSSAADQRLGGALMVLTCAAVAFPLVKRLGPQPNTHTPATEAHVH